MFDLARLGYDAGWAAGFTPYAARGLRPGRVTRVDRGGVDVQTAAADPVRATPTGALLAAAATDPAGAPTVGDWVAVRVWPDRRCTVEAVLPRRTAFVRGNAGAVATGQVLAANLDLVLVVMALSTVPNLNRLERFLALAWESGAEPVVVLTKADLARDAEQLAEDAAGAAPGASVLTVSALTGAGIEDLRRLAAPGRTLALLGQSGVGKSTLVNRLLDASVLTTAEVREDGKGRHTTTHRELFALPTGGVLVDTPGLRGVQLWEVSDGLDSAFADIDELARSCRFADCAHGAEPGCGVAAAVQDGRLTPRRVDSYRKLAREVVWIASRHDARLRSQARRKWRTIAKAQRQRGGRP